MKRDEEFEIIIQLTTLNWMTIKVTSERISIRFNPKYD